MSEGPGTVGRSPLGGAAVVGLLVALGHPLRVDDVVGREELVLLVLELVRLGALGQVQHALRVGDAPLSVPFLGGPPGRVVLAEQLGRLVQERHVGRGPVRPRRGRAPDQVGLVRGQVGGVRQEVGDQLLGGEGGPQRIDRRVHGGARRDLLAELGDVVRPQQVRTAVRIGAQPVGELRGERVDDREGEGGPRLVVRQPGGPGPVPRLVRHGAVQQQGPVLLVVDLQGGLGDGVVLLAGVRRYGLRQALPVGHHPGEDLRHRGPPLHRGGPGAVGAGGVHAGEELTRSGQQYARLAEGREHPADVAEEGRARTDDQHPALGEQLPVGVQQVRGAVQRDRGLAGAGTALDDQHPAVRGADDPVLLGLDGAHDVVHPAGPGGVERGEQHGVRVRALVAGALRVGQVEDLVVQGGDHAPPAADVPAAAQPHGGVTGGEVEGAGHVRAPVQDERSPFRVVGPDSEPADVVVPAVGELQTAETEAVLARIQGGKQTGLLGNQDVPLQPRLKPGTDIAQRPFDRPFGLVTQTVEALIEVVDELLLFPEFLG